MLDVESVGSKGLMLRVPASLISKEFVKMRSRVELVSAPSLCEGRVGSLIICTRSSDYIVKSSFL